MNFLFLNPSLAPLEAELAPIKDWEEIGDIWEISELVQCTVQPVAAE